MARQAMLLVADEIYYNLNGKGILHGIYHNDLTINSESAVAPQLIFFFIAETDLNDPFRSLDLEVILPGSEPVRHSVPVMWPIPTNPATFGRSKIFVRWPLLIPTPTLRPGRIEAKVFHDKGEIILGAPWITYNAPSKLTDKN